MRFVRRAGRWTAGLILGAVVGLLAMAAVGFASATAMDHPAYRFATTVAPSGGLNVVVAGDSLPRGMRAHDMQHGFAGLLFARVASLRAGSRLNNVSVPGARWRDIPRQVADVPAGRVDLVLLVTGGNDVMDATDPVSLARAALPAAMRFPLRELVTFDNALVERIAAHRGARLIDLQALSRSRAADDPRFISADGLHPNDAGHARLAAFAWPALDAALHR